MDSLVIYGPAFLFFLALWIYSKINFNLHYWKDRGVPQLEPAFFFGDVKHAGRKSVSELFSYFYNRFKRMGVKHGGVYMLSRKSWVPVDRALIKSILIKDFNHFTAHQPPMAKTIFFDNLFHMDGEKWQDMRRKLTPTFTSGKMKMMYAILLEKTKGLVRLVDEMIEQKETTDIKGLLARFTTDVIGSCGFGVECNSLEDVNSEFFQQGQKIFQEVNKNHSLVRMFFGIFGLVKPIKLDVAGIETFFSGVVKQTLDYREKNKIVRKDFMHLMIQLKNKGAVTEIMNENDDVYVKTVDKEVMSFHEIASQALLFFTAGFETSSTTMSYTLLELTQYQDVQKKLREEIRNVLKKYNGEMTYEALQEMTYADEVLNEALRMHPPVGMVPRTCTKTYKLPDSDIIIEKGTNVSIAVLGIHMDPDYFPEPEKFIPERFSAENKSKIQDMTYMPFGDGPRQCLGMRFGLLQSKIGLVSLINQFNFKLNEATPYPPKYLHSAFILTVDGGIYLEATRVP